jgi:YD repeat-containing protein
MVSPDFSRFLPRFPDFRFPPRFPPLVQVLCETDSDGIIQATYTYGNDLISMNRAGANYYYEYDGLGSVRQITDNSGTVNNSYTYDSFGNSVASVSSVANS